MTERTTVFIADDHPMYRQALVRALTRSPGLEVVGEAEDGRAALDAIRRLRPAVAVLDVEMPGLDGIAVLSALMREGVPLRVLMLSGSVRGDTVYRAIEAGASGFIGKDEDEHALSAAVLAVARGETVFGASVQAALADGVRARKPVARGPELTVREHEVLRLTAEGMSSMEIGRALHLSGATVKTHLQRVYSKLGVSDRAAAVAEAMRLELLR